MKKTLILLLSIFVFSSCSEIKKKTKENKEETKEVFVKNDTALLGYLLGTSKEDVERRTKELLKDGTLKPYRNGYATMSAGYAGAETRVETKGYPCSLYIGDKSIGALMDLVFYNDTLLRQEFYLGSNRVAYDLFEIYGPSVDVGGYPAIDSSSGLSFWHKNGRAIYTAEFFNLNYLYVEDMSFKIRSEKEKLEAKKVQKQLVKDINKEMSKDMGW